jgi:methionyl-tRNA formyltransferase
MKHRVIFLGTPKIAARCLQALLDTDVEVVGVITKPDKPVGRKQDIVLNPVKILALKHHLPVFQPIKMNEIYEKISSLKPDLMLSCAYGQLIPESVLQIPKFHCVNIHTSLLPRWRGGAPIH